MLVSTKTFSASAFYWSNKRETQNCTVNMLICFDLEIIVLKTSHAFVLLSRYHPAFLNFKTAGIWPFAAYAVLQHPCEQQAVPHASTPIKAEERGVDEENEYSLKIHDSKGFRRDKCRSGFWTQHLIIYMRTAWEFGGDCQKSSTVMSQVRN